MDTMPMIICILTKIGVQQIIDNIFVRHGNWPGLSYGHLVFMFVTYLLHSMIRRFSAMEQSWLNQQNTVIAQIAGWQIGEKDATDDRLDIMTQVLGGTDEGINNFQTLTGQGNLSAYQLPTQIDRNERQRGLENYPLYCFSFNRIEYFIH